MKIKQNMPMIIGKISKNDESVKFNIPIYCTECNKKVPGRILAEKRYAQSKAFRTELANFKKNYLCGICRDRKRVNKK